MRHSLLGLQDVLCRNAARLEPICGIMHRPMLTRLCKRLVQRCIREAAGPAASFSNLRLNPSAEHRASRATGQHTATEACTVEWVLVAANQRTCPRNARSYGHMCSTRKGVMPCQFVQLHPPGEGLDLDEAHTNQQVRHEPLR